MSTAVLESNTVQVTKEIPAEGTVTVTLAQVNSKRFKNYRKRATEAHLMDLKGSMKVHKQLTPCLGAWLEDGTIGLVGGFCRFEAMERLALESVIDKYNEANGKKPGDEGFVSVGGFGFDSRKEREKVLEAGGEWADKYKAALKGYNILFRTVALEDDADAALKNVVENTYEKPPLMDYCERIEELLQNKEISQKRIAKALKKSEPEISNYRKIYACPEFLTKLFSGPAISELTKDEAKQVELREQLLTAVAELKRRLSLEETDRQAISFSHAREFARSVLADKDPMTTAGIAKALRDLVVMRDDGKLSAEETIKYSVFIDKLKEAKRIGKKAEEPAPAIAGTVNQPGVAVSGANPPATQPATHDLSSLSKETTSAFDQAAQKLDAAEHPAKPPVSTGNQAAAPASQPASQPAITTPTVGQHPLLSPEDQARQAEIEAANAELPASERMDELTGPSTDDLLAGEAADYAVDHATHQQAAGEQAATGQMKKTTTEAPTLSKYKNPKTPEKIENAANRMLDYASDEERVTPIDQAGYLLAAVQLFNACGLEDAERAVNEAFANFIEKLNEYLALLELHVEQGKGAAVLKEIQAAKPKFVRPVLNK